MTRQRLFYGALVLGLGVVLGAMLLGDESPVAAPAPRDAPKLRSRPSAAQVAERRRRALARLTTQATGEQRTLTVTVRDCGLTAAADAEVTLTDGDGDGVPLAHGRSDAQGRFRARVPAVASLVVTAARDDHEGGASPGAGDAVAVDICPGATVEGHVVDQRGQPVANATVTLGDGQDVAVTDEDGEFTLTDLMLTSTRVTASAEAASAERTFAPLGPFEVRTLDLVLETGRRLLGVVVDPTGEAVAYARVVARDFADTVVADARTDRHGRFWLKEVPFTPVTLTADDGQGGIGTLFVEADARREDLVVTLQPAGRLTVDYVGDYRGAFQVVVVSLDREGGHQPPTPIATLAGSGDVVVLPAPRKYWVVYGDDAAMALCGEVLLTPGALSTVRCGEARPARVTGRVVDATGRPVGGAWVAIMAPGAGHDRTRTEANGRFSFALEVTRTVGAGLVASDPAGGYLATRRRNVPLAPGETTDLGDLRLDAADAFPGLGVAGPFGGIGAQVEAVDDGIRLRRIVKGGPLDLAGVRTGEVIIAIGAAASGFLPALDAVRLLRGEAGTDLTLRLRDEQGATREVQVQRSVIDVEAAGWVN